MARGLYTVRKRWSNWPFWLYEITSVARASLTDPQAPGYKVAALPPEYSAVATICSRESLTSRLLTTCLVRTSSSLKSNDYFKGEGFKNKSVQSLPDYSNIDREEESSQPSISTNSRPINSSTKKAVSLSNLNSINDKNVSKLGRIL